MVRGICIDCPPGARPRGVTRPGPRCWSHQRARKQRTGESRWAAHIFASYQLTPDQYWDLYEAQGGVCVICQRANGRTKRLSVDHDHACCGKPPTCGMCHRSLLCTTCNKLLGHLRDDPMAGQRIHDYLEEHTLRRIRRIGK